MPPHRKIEFISDGELDRAVRSTPDDLFVYWTGGSYPKQAGSLRSTALETITEIRKVVPVRELLRRAARLNGSYGCDPASVVKGLRFHQGSKPAVYLFVRRDRDGNLRAVTDIPYPGGSGRPVRAEEIIVSAHELIG